MKFDFIVIGSGLAGLTCALILKNYGRVLIITKKKLSHGATSLAQGGIVAVIGKEDSIDAHVKDTLVAGCFHNNSFAVRVLAENSADAIDWLCQQGVVFDKQDGEFALGLEAAHSQPRILHATDLTGREIEKALIKKIKKEDGIEIWEDCIAVKLITEDNHCFGVQIIKNGIVLNLFARSTVLASGGTGQLYLWTTNPEVATGDGYALAHLAGAKLVDMEFIQFHPTALKDSNSPACLPAQAGAGRPLFLLSESLRGEGGYLIKLKTQNSKLKTTEMGERFINKIDPKGELAPRDVVARAIYAQQKKGYEVYLDIRHKGKDFLLQRFPNIYKEVKKRGFDLAFDLVPVTPAAHYCCGGVKTDLFGRTNIDGLFAFGEVASTGVHGANRLASNSLLEAVVFPRRLPCCISSLPKKTEEINSIIPKYKRDILVDTSIIRKELKRIMWDKVGIVRTKKGLLAAKEKLKELEAILTGQNYINEQFLETKNMLTTAGIIIKAALSRPQSLGAHYIGKEITI